MNSVTNSTSVSNTFDALLDEINHQKRIITQLQSENRQLKTNETRINKTAESLRTSNLTLNQELTGLIQRVRELEIELTLPTNERTITVNKTLIEPFPKKKKQGFNWSYVVTPIIAVLAIFVGKWWAFNQYQYQASIAATTATVSAIVTSTPAPANIAAAAAPAPTNVVEEGYVVVENVIDKDGMVRVMDGFSQKARVLAWVNPGDKFKIRAQSPQKMRRTYVKNGSNVSVDDYFYKISDKEQWIHGFFTNKRTYNIN